MYKIILARFAHFSTAAHFFYGFEMGRLTRFLGEMYTNVSARRQRHVKMYEISRYIYAKSHAKADSKFSTGHQPKDLRSKKGSPRNREKIGRRGDRGDRPDSATLFINKAGVQTSKRAAFPKFPCAAALAALACRFPSFLE